MIGVLLAQLYYDRKLAKSGNPEAYRSCGNLLFGLIERSFLVAWGVVLVGLFLTTFFIFYYKAAYPMGTWGLGASMVWTALSRPLFVLGMMMVLVPTFEGRLSWFKSFMSNALFKVVGKLTYSAYLIHIAVMLAFYASSNNSELESRDGGIFYFFGIYVLSYFAAVVITLLVELPTLNIEKSILFPSKPASKSEKKEEQFLTKDI